VSFTDSRDWQEVSRFFAVNTGPALIRVMVPSVRRNELDKGDACVMRVRPVPEGDMGVLPGTPKKNVPAGRSRDDLLVAGTVDPDTVEFDIVSKAKTSMTRPGLSSVTSSSKLAGSSVACPEPRPQ